MAGSKKILTAEQSWAIAKAQFITFSTHSVMNEQAVTQQTLLNIKVSRHGNECIIHETNQDDYEPEL